MPVLTVLRRTAFVALASLAGCAASPHAPRGAYERHLALPADVAAAIAAGAVRLRLPFADPVPQAAGAPASVVGDSFVVVYECGRDGTWIPRATHRLTLRGTDHAAAVVHAERLGGNLCLPGFGSLATARLEVRVRADADGALVCADLPPCLAADVAGALDRAFALAADPDAACTGLAEPNLAAFVGGRARTEARQRLLLGDPAGAEAQLQRAARLSGPTARQQHQLGTFAAQAGDVLLAQHRLGDALLLARDPALRAHLAAQIVDLADPTAGRAARADLAPGAATTAERALAATRLHTERRRRCDPVADYRTASQLHRQQHDEMAALACALLAREHAPVGGTVPLAHDGTVRRGLDEFVRKLGHGIEPVAAGVVREVPTAPAAAPAR